MNNYGRSHLLKLLIVAGFAFCAGNGHAQTTRVTQSGTVSGTLPQSLRLPVGLSFKVRLKDSLDSRVVTAGILWSGVLADDLVSPQGRVYAIEGSPVTGIVTTVRPALNDQPASISLRAISISGVELYTTNRTRDGALAQSGDVRTNGSATGPIGGFVTSDANQQVNLKAGTLLTFNTSVP
jgi:hypothetical protein